MEEGTLSGTIRANIEVGDEVFVVKKQHQKTNELTHGVVKGILTKSPKHTHGIKVILETNEVGRVKKILK